jgi:D-glycero-D-manno-heptose 1,7-bisphosphate phosphatase
VNSVKRALFLDRDGVINEDLGHVGHVKDFHFLPGIFEFCAKAQELGFALIVVTNQAGIAKGKYSEEEFNKLNEWMLGQFRVNDIHITAVYYCPYHPEATIDRFRKSSEMRKPNTGMLLQAALDHDLVLSESVIIGDSASDMVAGISAGLGLCILLRPHGSAKIVGAVQATDFECALRLIMGYSPS